MVVDPRMPITVSRITISRMPPAMLAATRMRLPSGVNFAALPSRLISACLRLRWASSRAGSATGPGQSGEARIFLIQDDNLTAEVPLRRSILQSTLRQKYRSTGRHNPQRDGGPEKGLYRLHPIALATGPHAGRHEVHLVRDGGEHLTPAYRAI